MPLCHRWLIAHLAALYAIAAPYVRIEFITIGIIKTAWRHGKTTPSLTKVFRQRTSRLNFFARITSVPMSFRFCADGVAVLGTVRILAAQSKRRSSAGACVDGNWTQLSPASCSRPCKIEIQGQKSMAGFKQPDFIEPREAAAKARKLALEKFRAKAADPALAERLTARAARAAEARSSRRQSGVAVCATGALTARRGAKTKIWTTLNNVSALR